MTVEELAKHIAGTVSAEHYGDVYPSRVDAEADGATVVFDVQLYFSAKGRKFRAVLVEVVE